MADNVDITPGSGKTISTEEVTTLNGSTVSAQHVQRVAVALRTADGTVIDLSGDAANGLDVDITRFPATAATAANQDTTNTALGATNETAPASDTATSGLNGRLQRVAQNLTTANTALGTTTDAAVTAGATGSLSAKLRSISRDIVSNIVLAAGAARIGKVTIRNAADAADIDPLADSTFTARIGEVQASPTANTVLDRLKALATLLGGGLPAALAANGGLKVEGVAGGVAVPVQAGGYTAVVFGSLTRPADTTAYAAGDGVTTATSSASAMTVTNAARTAAGSGVILGGKATKSTTSTTNAQFRIWIYQAAPSAVPNDNAAFTAAVLADYQKLVCTATFDFAAGVVGSDGVEVPITVDRVNPGFKLSSGQDLTVIWEARAAYTPGNAEVFRLALDVSQD